MSSDYRVLWVNDDYTMAVVNGGDTVWFLGRGAIDQDMLAVVIARMEQRGFDLDNLILSEEACYG
jgi:lipocalin